MTRSLALWSGCAAVLAVVVATVTVAAFPRESRTVRLPAIPAARQPASGPPVAVSVNLGPVATTARVADIRGGAAGATRANADSGEVGFVQTKKVVRRRALIGASSGPNRDSGLATGTGGSRSTPSQSP